MSQTNDIDIKSNPLLAPYDTPFGAIPYDRITLGHYIPAIKEGIRKEEEAVEDINTELKRKQEEYGVFKD